MGDDAEFICTACGRQKQQHALIVRDDGVVIAGSIADPYGDWTICAEGGAAADHPYQRRCFCPCHEFPGTYPPPCGYCGHDTRQGTFPGSVREGWTPNAG